MSLAEPKPKKLKTEEGENPAAKAEDESAPESVVQRTEDGDALFELSAKRRCTVRKWKNNVLVDIREVRRCTNCVSECTLLCNK